MFERLSSVCLEIPSAVFGSSFLGFAGFARCCSCPMARVSRYSPRTDGFIQQLSRSQLHNCPKNMPLWRRLQFSVVIVLKQRKFVSEII